MMAIVYVNKDSEKGPQKSSLQVFVPTVLYIKYILTNLV